MATDQECVGYARECLRLAGLTDEPEIRDQLFGLAREWMATAMHDRDVLIFPPVDGLFRTPVTAGPSCRSHGRETPEISSKKC